MKPSVKVCGAEAGMRHEGTDTNVQRTTTHDDVQYVNAMVKELLGGAGAQPRRERLGR